MNFGSLLKGIVGAGTGLATGGIGGAITGGLGGMFGGGQHEDPVMRQQRLQQQGIANQMLGYANSVPGSAPDELANFAQARGQLGASQRANQQRIMGAYNANQGTSGANLLQNLGNTNIAQQMAQHASFLQNASANRRQALMNAASLGQGAASLYRPQQNQFGQSMAQLAQLLAYNQARRQAQASAPVPGDIPVGGTGADLTGAQFQGPPQPGPLNWQQIGASGALGSPQQEDMSIYGTPSWLGALGQPSAAVQATNAETGRNAPGQVVNGVNNTIRQSNGFSTPAAPGIPGSPNMMLLNMLARQLMMPGGGRLNF
jgi:hypothetical protein